MCSPFVFFPRSSALFVCAVFLSLFSGTSAASSPGYEVVDGKNLYKMGWGDDLCAVTFDDGPGSHTGRLLEILEERGIPATFFLVGNQIKYHGELVRRIQAAGHEIANHTQNHVTLRHRGLAAQRAEMETVQKMLQALGVTSRFLRPPYGRYDADTVRIAAELGMEIVLWSIDSMDWSHTLRLESLRPQVRGQKLRGIFLFHDTHAPTVAGMADILDRLSEDGCKFVTVSTYLELVRSKRHEGAPVQAQNEPASNAPGSLPKVGPKVGPKLAPKLTPGIGPVEPVEAMPPAAQPVPGPSRNGEEAVSAQTSPELPRMEEPPADKKAVSSLKASSKYPPAGSEASEASVENLPAGS